MDVHRNVNAYGRPSFLHAKAPAPIHSREQRALARWYEMSARPSTKA